MDLKRTLFSDPTTSLTKSITAAIPRPAVSRPAVATQPVAPASVKTIPLIPVAVDSARDPRTPPIISQVSSADIPPVRSISPDFQAMASIADTQSDRNLSDSDSDMEKGPKSNARKSAKRKWANKMFDCLPKIQKLPAPQSDSVDFWGTQAKPTSHDFPVLPMHPTIAKQLSSRVDFHFNRFKAIKRKFNQSKAYNSIYRATDESHFSLRKAHAVSATLLAEMKPDMI